MKLVSGIVNLINWSDNNMAKVFMTKKAFDGLDDSSLEYGIISKQTKVYLDLSDEELNKLLIPEDDEIGNGTNTLFDFQQEHTNVSFLTGKELFEQVKNNNYSSLTKIPDGIFVLNVDQPTAEKIKKQFGVICMSEEHIDFSILTRRHVEFCEREIKDNAVDYDLSPKPKHVTANDLIPDDMILPCNSVVVIDKYLFDDDKEGTCIAGLLARLLPRTLNAQCPCHLLIIYDNSKAGATEEMHKLAFKNISEIMYPVLKKINGLDITVEFLAGDFAPPKMFEDLHNRKIVTNYTLISAEHGFGMYDGHNRMKWDQEFSVEALYSDGLSNSSVTPDKKRQIILKKVGTIVKYAQEKFDKGNKRPQFRYGKNDKCNPTKISPNELENRLVIFS